MTPRSLVLAAPLLGAVLAMPLHADPPPSFPIPTPAQIDAMAALLPASPQGVGRPITDRAAWITAGRQPIFQKEEKDAAAFLTQPDPVLTDALFNEVLTTGRRDTYETPFRLRSTRLVAFALAEGMENQGKYLPAIEAELNAMLGEKSWAVPAHVLLSKPYGGLDRSIDLGTSARAWTLATVDYWLGDKLAPATRARLRAEVKRRVFDNYEDSIRTGTPHWGWMYGNNNWNAVCTSGVLGAALALLPDPRERALFVLETQESMKYYLSGFPDDGYAQEGLGYWSYGFGSYLCLSETIYEATHGSVNLLAGAKVRQIALFPRHFEIIDGIFPAFGDSGVAKAHGIAAAVDSALLFFINQRWGMGWTDLDPAKNNMYATHPLGDRTYGFGLFGFPLPVYHGSIVAGSPPVPEETAQGNLRFFFQANSVFLARSERPGAARFGFALKGGYNAGGHGHNDNGTYVVANNGEALLLDPGMESYTAQSFGPHRYESMFMNSYGHDVPWVGRTMQTNGPDAKGTIVRTDFTDDRDTVVMDLTSSYSVPSLQKLTRTYVFDRTKPALEITDEASFTAPTDFGSALITYGSWKEVSPGTFLVWQGKAAVRATVTVDSGTLVTKAETVTGHSQPKHPPERIGLNLSAPAMHVVMRTLIVPATVP